MTWPPRRTTVREKTTLPLSSSFVPVRSSGPGGRQQHYFRWPFIISDQIPGQTQFESQHFDDGYGSVLSRNHSNTNFSQSLIPSIHALGERMSRAMDLLPVPIVPEERQMMDLLGAGNESGSSHHAQRLSLSLGSRRFLNSDILIPNYFAGQNREVFSDDYSFKASTSSNQSFSNSIANSRYLRPATATSAANPTRQNTVN